MAGAGAASTRAASRPPKAGNCTVSRMAGASAAKMTAAASPRSATRPTVSRTVGANAAKRTAAASPLLEAARLIVWRTEGVNAAGSRVAPRPRKVVRKVVCCTASRTVSARRARCQAARRPNIPTGPHGGGKRCEEAGCLTAQVRGHGLLLGTRGGASGARRPVASPRRSGGTAYCWAHGGGKRCTGVGAAGGICGNKPVPGSEPACCWTHRGGKQYDKCVGAKTCTRRPVRGTELCEKHTCKPGEEPAEGGIQD
jgi:hypothetical protein